MAAMQNVTENLVLRSSDNQLSLRQRIAGFLAEVPEPAAQSAALQLLRTKITLDRSFAFFMGALAMVVVEELL
jgi:hypothetical protein